MRIVFNGVRDFLYFHLIEWPVFNVADCCFQAGQRAWGSVSGSEAEAAGRCASATWLGEGQHHAIKLAVMIHSEPSDSDPRVRRNLNERKKWCQFIFSIRGERRTDTISILRGSLPSQAGQRRRDVLGHQVGHKAVSNRAGTPIKGDMLGRIVQ
jgi:Signal peptidase (SPase) II